MKTIAQQLNIKDFPFQIYDKRGNMIYLETHDGFWAKREYDSNGKPTYYENSCGFWEKREYDSDGNETYYENSDGYRYKREYDSDGNETYFENSDGFWERREYDSNGKETYFEDSKGDKRGRPALIQMARTNYCLEVCEQLLEKATYTRIAFGWDSHIPPQPTCFELKIDTPSIFKQNGEL